MQWFVPYAYSPSPDAGYTLFVTPLGTLSLPLQLSQFYGLVLALFLVFLTILWHLVPSFPSSAEIEEEIEPPYTMKKKQDKKKNDQDDTNEEARSALHDNIQKNGENSYYYAHKVRDVLAPTKLKPIVSQYGWSDGRKTISIYVDHPRAMELEKDAITITWSTNSLSLDITFDDNDVRSLVVPKLYGSIQDVSYKAKKDSIVFTLKKKAEISWKSLNAAAKDLDQHIEYDESLYD
ncbi:hypothetical protein THRCLA_02060 [Thraustotheca clavata]|uniref:CS domain-containing protein n=1 Tax=Thraustotheca clavata TaxID=74557 RepID=A0A1W0A770_9STRA|nr:hypothetical protein THRCLA_02060 [Thraustotheca clavata]